MQATKKITTELQFLYQIHERPPGIINPEGLFQLFTYSHIRHIIKLNNSANPPGSVRFV